MINKVIISHPKKIEHFYVVLIYESIMGW